MNHKEEELVKLAERGANDAHLFLFDKINKLNDRFDEIKIEIEKVRQSKHEINIPSFPETLNVNLDEIKELLTELNKKKPEEEIKIKII